MQLIQSRFIHTRLLRLSFSRRCRANHCLNLNMSTKTIAVLDDAELKDGQMYVHPASKSVSNLIHQPGKKLASKMERFFYLVWAIRYTPLVHFVPITEHP